MASAADLSSDLLQHIGSFLDLRNRARASCVCKLWLAALPSAPIERLELRREDTSRVWTWLRTHRPPIETLIIRGVPGLIRKAPDTLVALLSACLKGTKALTITFGNGMPYLSGVLLGICSWAPHLEVFSASDNWNWTTWGDLGESVGQLTALKQLELCLKSCEEGQELQLPRLASLSTLKLTILDKAGHVKLGGEQLPSLAQLSVRTDASTVELSAEAPGFSQLREVWLSFGIRGASKAILDFGSMPALQQANFSFVRELEGWESIAKASASLSILSFAGLHDDWEEDHDNQDTLWLVGLLRALPQSVKGLQLNGRWGQGVRDALSQATQLWALGLWPCSADRQLPPDAPLWTGVRALGCYHDHLGGSQGTVAAMPEGLRAARNLEILQLKCSRLFTADMDLIQSLPALKKLYLGDRFKDQHQVAELRRAMPQVAVSLEVLGPPRSGSLPFWSRSVPVWEFAFLEHVLAALR